MTWFSHLNYNEASMGGEGVILQPFPGYPLKSTRKIGSLTILWTPKDNDRPAITEGVFCFLSAIDWKIVNSKLI